jgi:cytochrome P450
VTTIRPPVSDPFGPAAAADPDQYVDVIRAAGPVCPLGDDHTFLLTGYDDLTDALRRPGDFSSDSTRKAMAMVRAGLLRTDPEVMALGSQLLVTDPVLQRADPPQHTRSRKTVSRWFTVKRVRAEWQPLIEQNCREVFDAITADEPFDAMPALAIPLPIRVIADILGLDRSSDADLKRWSDANVRHAGRRLTAGDAIAQARSNVELLGFIRAELADRRGCPRDDLTSHLAALVVDGVAAEQLEDGQLTAAEAVDIIAQIIVAGNETTTQLLGELLVLLAENPDLYGQLREDRSLVPGAIDEALRLASPVFGLMRVAGEAAAAGGVTLPTGGLVTVLFGAANRDPEQFPAPDVFDPQRPNSDSHVAFGVGIHYCLGAALARAETRAFLETLLDRFAGVELLPSTPGDVEHTVMMRGRRRLPLRLLAKRPNLPPREATDDV